MKSTLDKVTISRENSMKARQFHNFENCLNRISYLTDRWYYLKELVRENSCFYTIKHFM